MLFGVLIKGRTNDFGSRSLDLARMSVTSSGRSSMSNTNKWHSAWLCKILVAMFCRRMVLPVLGGATIRPRCPLPMGVIQIDHSHFQVVRPGFQDKSAARMDGDHTATAGQIEYP